MVQDTASMHLGTSDVQWQFFPELEFSDNKSDIESNDDSVSDNDSDRANFQGSFDSIQRVADTAAINSATEYAESVLRWQHPLSKPPVVLEDDLVAAARWDAIRQPRVARAEREDIMCAI